MTEAEALERTWAEKPGFSGWLMSVNHRDIGRRFIVTAFIFFLLAGLMAATMRLQLARADNTLVGPDLYNRLFSLHGTTMMFLFAVPIMQAMGIYLVPLMVGARNIAFPRLVAFGYWLYVCGGIMIMVFFLARSGPDAGWFSYVPLSGPEYDPGKRADSWAQMITFTEVAALVVSVSIIVTAFKLRAPGMTLNRIPLFVWAQVVTAFMVLIAMPAVMLASSFLITDRLVQTQFFNPAKGGDALLWQHMFWFFGHPEVYIIFIPALGMVSQIVPVFARRRIFGYLGLVMSLVATGFLAFGLWVHHMFATGLPPLGLSFFTTASILIAIPSGLQIFCWIATLATGREVRLATPLLFIIGFFFIFVIGGLTGVMLGSAALDPQLHDSYFVVAHLHYVLIGGGVFPLFGAFYYWFPKMTGRMLSERAGKWNFWLFFIGFNLAFFPMHILGLDGMTRRIYTYGAGTGWEPLNLLATAGALLIALSVIVFMGNVIASLRRGAQAAPDPWGAGTLEWATSSPPPSYNFLRVTVVTSRDPLWDEPQARTLVTGIPADFRAVLVTRLHDAEPDCIKKFPSPSIWPLLTALATTVMFIGSIFTPWAVVWGSIPIAITMTGWFWPSRDEAAEERRHEVKPNDPDAAAALRPAEARS